MTFLLVAALLYFLPAIIGHNKRDSTGIFILNLVAGWTVIGWFVALLWACASDSCPRARRFVIAAVAARWSPRERNIAGLAAGICNLQDPSE
jgi:Superinfection immunity protein